MKKLLLVTVACAATALTGFAQDGVVNFNTRTVNAVVLLEGGVDPAGAGIMGQLLWGTDAASLAPVGTATEFYTGGIASRKGTVSGGAVTIAGAGDVAGFMALIAWDGSYGSYEQAKAGGGQTGMSPAFAITPNAPPKPPTDLVGLEGFTMSTEIIPEPSTFALGLLGIGALMLRRRK